MSTENRIVGPGYYPKRPSPQVYWHRFSVAIQSPCGALIELHDKDGNPCGDVAWVGRGLYTHLKSAHPRRTVHRITVRANQIIYEHVLPVKDQVNTIGFKMYLDSNIQEIGYKNDYWAFTSIPR